MEIFADMNAVNIVDTLLDNFSSINDNTFIYPYNFEPTSFKNNFYQFSPYVKLLYTLVEEKFSESVKTFPNLYTPPKDFPSFIEKHPSQNFRITCFSLHNLYADSGFYNLIVRVQSHTYVIFIVNLESDKFKLNCYKFIYKNSFANALDRNRNSLISIFPQIKLDRNFEIRHNSLRIFGGSFPVTRNLGFGSIAKAAASFMLPYIKIKVNKSYMEDCQLEILLEHMVNQFCSLGQNEFSSNTIIPYIYNNLTVYQHLFLIVGTLYTSDTEIIVDSFNKSLLDSEIYKCFYEL